MKCGCCIELDTPETIYEIGNDYYEAGTDIFEEIFDDTNYENATIMIQALWWKWRDFCIASCNTPKWARAMSDRLGLVGHKWDAIISKAAAEDTDLTNLDDRAYIRTIQRTPMDGTQGDQRTVSHTGSDVETTEHEALPQTASTATQYLDSRGKVTTTPGVTDTETYAPNTQDKEIFEADDTITAVTFSDMMNNYPNVLLGFVDEFKDYFIDRWYRWRPVAYPSIRCAVRCQAANTRF